MTYNLKWREYYIKSTATHEIFEIFFYKLKYYASKGACPGHDFPAPIVIMTYHLFWKLSFMMAKPNRVAKSTANATTTAATQPSQLCLKSK